MKPLQEMYIITKYVCFLWLLNHVNGIDYDGWLNIKLEHSLNCGADNFCPRGNIALKSIRASTTLIEQIPFSSQTVKKLEELAEVDGFYTIRALVTSAENKETEFLSSMKASSYLKSGLSDVVNAWMLPNGAVTAINFQVRNSNNTLTKDSSNGFKLHSSFYLRFVDTAPVPDTASYVQKLEREREAREKGEVKDNRSFLVKYWMYIVPIAIFFMISGAASPEGGQASR